MPWKKKSGALYKRERTKEKDNGEEKAVNKFWKMKSKWKNGS